MTDSDVISRIRFGVLVDGPDDIYGPMSKDDALEKANEINKVYLNEVRIAGLEATPMCIAVALHWSEIAATDLDV